MKKQMMQYILPAALALGMAAVAHAQSDGKILFADGTAVPVQLTRTLDTAKAKAGDSVTAKTMQIVYAENQVQVAPGSVVTGHVVSVTRHNETAQQTASLELLFDHVRMGLTTMTVQLRVRAVASSYEAYDAEYLMVPQLQSPYTHALIGGDRTTPGSTVLYSKDGDRIGYENKNGRFGKLIAAPDAGLQCESTSSPQSLAIFAPEACGVYGFDHVTMRQTDSGAVLLTARRHDVALFSGSALLLQAHSAIQEARRLPR